MRSDEWQNIKGIIMQKSDFFEGITQAPVKVGNYDIHVPIFYQDITSMGVFLLAPLDFREKMN